MRNVELGVFLSNVWHKRLYFRAAACRSQSVELKQILNKRKSQYRKISDTYYQSITNVSPQSRINRAFTLDWQSRGQRFDPANLHQQKGKYRFSKENRYFPFAKVCVCWRGFFPITNLLPMPFFYVAPLK